MICLHVYHTKKKRVKMSSVVAENHAAVGRGGQDLRHRARQEDERVSTSQAKRLSCFPSCLVDSISTRPALTASDQTKSQAARRQLLPVRHPQGRPPAPRRAAVRLQPPAPEVARLRQLRRGRRRPGQRLIGAPSPAAGVVEDGAGAIFLCAPCSRGSCRHASSS